MEDFSYYFTKYATDKHPTYTPVYNDYFGPRRNDCVNLLEIGIGTLGPGDSSMGAWKNLYRSEYKPGASLRAFKEYFQNGKIYGIDIQPDCVVEEDRIKTFLFDARNKNLCDEHLLDIKFDFIIDDSDHHADSQIKTFENMFPRLNANGVYILEDLLSPEDIRAYLETKPHQYIFRDRLVVITPKL